MKRISKLTCLALFAAVMLLLGTTSCTREDNPKPIDISALEQELVGLWWDEFEYADVTEDGVPFTHVLLAVEVNADHTGCIYAAVFNDTDEEPLAIYGGYDDAGFTWQLKADGTIVLGDPETGETYELAPSMTRAMTRGNSGSYGDNVTDTSNTNMNYNNGSMTVNNGNYSGTLNKANGNTENDIKAKLRKGIQSNVDLGSGGKTPKDFGEDNIR